MFKITGKQTDSAKKHLDTQKHLQIINYLRDPRNNAETTERQEVLKVRAILCFVTKLEMRLSVERPRKQLVESKGAVG